MSKFTNMQILATIERLEATIRQSDADPKASTSAMRQRRKKLPDYKAELAEREATGADPGATSLQDIRYGGSEDASGPKCVITITDQAITIEWDPALPAGRHPVSKAELLAAAAVFGMS